MDNASAAMPGPRICPFLRAAADGRVLEPVLWPDQANACTALGDVAPQSLRQQEYACLASAHVNCPRFVRGLTLMAETTPVTAESGLRLTPAIIAALLVLAASFVLSVGFVIANGGMDLQPFPGASPQAAVQSSEPSPTASAPPSPAPSTAPSPTPSVQASVGSATATPTAQPTPSPTAAATPTPSSDRYALLEPCGDEPDCWIYTVRQGDNLVSIANYFGVALETVYERNPWAETTPLVAGQELRLPPPTR